MKIIVTGSLGHISRPLVEKLVQKGHMVTVISSNPEKQKDIEALGAKAAIGTMEDVDFLSAAFKNAETAYLMEAFGSRLFDQKLDLMAAHQKIANNYAQAILRSGIKRVVHLSSIGAHMDKGNGILASHYQVESILNTMLPEVAITFMRPVGFYYNLLAFIPAIKTAGAIVSNYGGNDKEPWVSPADIASAIAEEMEIRQPAKRKILYVASDERSPNEVAGILGEAIGKPDLKWLAIPDEQLLDRLKASGMNPQTAAGFVEMNASRRGGILYEDYYRNKPVLGKIKLTDFAKDFAVAFFKS